MIMDLIINIYIYIYINSFVKSFITQQASLGVSNENIQVSNTHSSVVIIKLTKIIVNKGFDLPPLQF